MLTSSHATLMRDGYVHIQLAAGGIGVIIFASASDGMEPAGRS